MKAILIDDEQQNLDNLRALLAAYCPQIQVCAMAHNADSGYEMLVKHQPDLLFLDIQMPGQTGFDLLRRLTTYNFEVIFVTAYDQYAIQALRFAATDYLLKPIDINDLKLAVERATKQRQLKVQNQQLENLVSILNGQQQKDEQRLALSTAKETRFVKPVDIVFCESSNNYTTISLANGEQLLVCKPIYEYEDLLKDHGFIRCHQSYLVNKHLVKSWKKEYGDFLLMNNGKEIPVARSKRDHTRHALHW